MAGIVFFNLLSPYGKILAVFGPFRVTQGGLVTGLRKAVTLEGLVMLSKASIRDGLSLPGFPGALLGESFRLLEKISLRKGLITRKHFIEGLDELLLELSAGEEGEDRQAAGLGPPVGVTHTGEPVAGTPRRLPGLLLLAAAAALTAALTVLPEGIFLSWLEPLARGFIGSAGGGG
jgi:hypothetical protein